MNFNGPLFIVGLPRSGTKLLRDLLNNHSKISIPVHESLFLPRFISHFGIDYDINTVENKKILYEALLKTKFVNNYSYTITESQTFTANTSSWKTFFKNILCFYSPKPIDETVVWGDKTPNYVLNYTLLNTIYPECKFVHIIRDPRDNVLSVKKAWNRSMIRAALNWKEVMDYVKKEKLRDQKNYMEVKYEDLLISPNDVLKRICDFVGVGFEPQMSYLKKPTENLGDAKNISTIVTSNFNKFQQMMSPKLLKKIEGITGKEAVELGYDVSNHSPVAVGWFEKKILRMYDIIQATKFHIAEKGLLKGLFFAVRLHIDSRM